MTWRAISEKLKGDYDIDLTLQAVRTFFKKASVRKEMPLGFGPDPQQPQPTPAQPAAEVQRHNKELKGSEAYEKGLAEKITNAPKPKLKIID
jgi:hypothetical protein